MTVTETAIRAYFDAFNRHDLGVGLGPWETAIVDYGGKGDGVVLKVLGSRCCRGSSWKSHHVPNLRKLATVRAGEVPRL